MSVRSCAMPFDGLPAEDQGRVYYFARFPNMLLRLRPDYVILHTLCPQVPGRTQTRCQWLFDPVQNETPDFHPKDAVQFWDMTNRQDWQVLDALDHSDLAGD